MAAPPWMTRTRPARSAAMPTSGASPYIPTMCRAMTSAERSDWPWSFMCSGVIVITATIEVCEIDHRQSPDGRRRNAG